MKNKTERLTRENEGTGKVEAEQLSRRRPDKKKKQKEKKKEQRDMAGLKERGKLTAGQKRSLNPSGTLPSHPRVKRLFVRSSDKEEKMEIEKAYSNHFIMEDQRRI